MPIVADFKLSDFDLTSASVPAAVLDPYGQNWTLVNPYKVITEVDAYGSILQKEPQVSEEYYDDTALRADSYVVIPQTNAISEEYFFEARPVDYQIIKLQWSSGVTLYSQYYEEPVPTELIIKWDTLGEPQTVANGYPAARVTADNFFFEKEHEEPFPSGAWVYYSIFVKYSSTAYRHWYEKVGSVHVQVPHRYESTDMLWQRIPRHYRLQDDNQYLSPLEVPDELLDKGPLYRLLNTFGWDIDRIRSLVHHQMVTRDPMLATTEALDALAEEVGLSMSSVDLGTERLRNYLNDIGYLRKAKGTLDGVRETITAITGSDVEIIPTVSNVLPSGQSVFNTTVTTTTSASVAPTAGNWVLHCPEFLSASVPPAGSVLISKSASTYDLLVAKTRVANVNQGSWYRMYYDVISRTNASVVGVEFIPITQTSGSVVVEPATGRTTVVSYPIGNIRNIYSVTGSEYEAPVELGLSGDGTFTTKDMYINMYIVLGPSSNIRLNNFKVLSDDRFPYEIRVYSQRINMCRDPKFRFGANTNQYWDYSITTGSASVGYPGDHIIFKEDGVTPTNASVTLVTTLSNNYEDTHIPVRLGIPYYFAVSDYNKNITSVELVSATYGTISEATSPFSDYDFTNPNNANNTASRRVWELLRPYEAPWLPRNVTDCYLRITIGLPAGTSCDLYQPMLQPLNSGLDYFDGDEVNGGWLAGDTASAGVADYRWGDNGQHNSFSYYTSDYRRTVVTTLRLLDTILPVTQTGDPISYVKFDSIYGYDATGMP